MAAGTKGKMAAEKKAGFAGRQTESLPVRLLKDMRKNWILYVMILPVVVYYIIFAYAPIYGIQLAFKDYIVKKGIWGSPWIGMENFTRFFSSYNFGLLLKNTIGISVYSILVGFPIPIIFALMLNYLKNKYLKKTVQMVSYAPYFISTVVMCGMITIFLNPDTGIFNTIRGFFGMESVDFLGKPELFKSIYVWTGVWQGMGWSSIIYISALSGVDYQLHEAAIVDGANKLQRVLHIDIPGILPTITILLIMRSGSIMSVGFEKVFLMQTSLNLKRSQVISTYVYQVGLVDADFSFASAVGFFNSVVNFIMIMLVNFISGKVSETSLW